MTLRDWHNKDNAANSDAFGGFTVEAMFVQDRVAAKCGFLLSNSKIAITLVMSAEVLGQMS